MSEVSDLLAEAERIAGIAAHHEVQSRNPDVELLEIEALCTRYRIRGYSDIRDELQKYV